MPTSLAFALALVTMGTALSFFVAPRRVEPSERRGADPRGPDRRSVDRERRRGA